MAKYLMIWCHYNPDMYMGHHNRKYEAKDMADAIRLAEEHIQKTVYAHIKVEYQVVEIVQESNYMIWDVAKKGRA